MTFETFRQSLAAAAPPPGLPPALLALWWAGRDDWARAHDIVQQHEGEPQADAVHAHLHRLEGDAGNARYWYRQAGRSPCPLPPPQEWTALCSELLAAD